MRTPDQLSKTPKDVDDVAASLIIEEEFGTTSGYRHPHNGYWAGDFSSTWRDTDSTDS